MKRVWCCVFAGLFLISCLSGCSLFGKSSKDDIFRTEKDSKYLVLINKDNEIKEAYDLMSEVYHLQAAEEVKTEWKSSSRKKVEMKLEGKTNSALSEMFSAMRAAGITDVYVTSAYRDKKTQEGLFNEYCRNEEGRISGNARAYFGDDYIKENYEDKGVLGLTAEDAEEVANFYSARAGYSEHQSGLCVDLITAEMKDVLSKDFENSPAFEWLQANAHRYGFILRYPKDKESVTGYSYEPWHYRFVGLEAATEIHDAGLALEEYLSPAT